MKKFVFAVQCLYKMYWFQKFKLDFKKRTNCCDPVVAGRYIKAFVESNNKPVAHGILLEITPCCVTEIDLLSSVVAGSSNVRRRFKSWWACCVDPCEGNSVAEKASASPKNAAAAPDMYRAILVPRKNTLNNPRYVCDEKFRIPWKDHNAVMLWLTTEFEKENWKC